jgi:GAF domain-containing protein/DNA-binding response OmpR family regulator
MTCPRCRQDTLPGATLCPKCGASVRPSARRPGPAGTGPNLSAIAKTAARLCDAQHAQILLVEGNQLRVVGKYGSWPGSRRLGEMHPLTRDTATGRAIIDRRTVHIRDLKAAVRTQYPGLKPRQRTTGTRTMLTAPLLSEGAAIGVIMIRRVRVRPFTSKQIALLEAFAEHAATAIDKTRLAQVLAEALEQQTATSEILRVISSSPTDLQPVLDTIAASAARLCDSIDAQIFRIDGEVLRIAASYGELPKTTRAESRPINRGSVNGRAVVDRRTIHIHDLAAESDSEWPVAKAYQKRFGHRTTLATPLLREGVPLGAITIRRMEVRPFSDKQITLLETFADQAVIAIENVRLFRSLTEALEQQTATSEILRVISSSPTTLDPVLEAVVKTAARLCEASNASLYRIEGDLMRKVAGHGSVRTTQEVGDTRPVTRGTVRGRASLERRTLHIPDLLAEVDTEYPETRDNVRREGIRTFVATPLLREGVPIGAIAVYRTEVRPFSDKQIGLLQTFADQAVIAIENVRLFKELEARNSDLTEALEQQTATSEILRVISRSPTDVQPVFESIVDSAVRLCSAEVGNVTRFDGEWVHMAAMHADAAGIDRLRKMYPARPSGALASLRSIRDRAVVHIPDLLEDEEYQGRQAATAAGFRAVLSVPMLRDDQAIGSLSVGRAAPGRFSDKQIALLQTFADQAVIAIENVRLFKELEARNSDLSVALEQQTATSEILRVISQSQTDVQPVFDTIVRSAVRLCDGLFSALLQFDGELLHHVAQHNYTPEALEQARRLYPTRPSRAHGSGRTILERAVVHIPDNEVDPEFQHQALSRAVGWRSGLFVPMLREGAPIGVIMVARAEPGPFSDNEIELLKTFADQAVIAIENVRLFKELEARNRDLTEALEQQTATAEILRAISSSPTDIRPVLETLVHAAARFCGATNVALLNLDGRVLRGAAAAGPFGEELIRSFGCIEAFEVPVNRGSVTGRAVSERRTVHIHDLAAVPETEFPVGRELQRKLGHRTLVATPLLREGTPIGAILLFRTDVKPFSDKQLELLRTFADQAVIAIENVRLFKELEGRNRDLSVALEQQTATSEILRVISQSQTDVQPVFETMAANALRLCDAKLSAVFRFDGELIHLVALNQFSPEGAAAIRDAFPMRPGKGSITARAILTRGIVHIPDVREDPEYVLQGLAQLANYRSNLSVPMLRDGHPIGAITVAKAEPGPFPDKQIALLQTFADQAVIAIENVRLFKELEARTGELTRSVEQLTALGEIGRAVTSTLDVETVLNTIVSRASQLAGADGCAISEYDEATEEFQVRATHNLDTEIVEALRRLPLRKGEGTMGRAAEMREPVQIPDITQPGAYQSSVRDALIRFGYRALLSVPLLRENQIIGSLSLNRKAPGAFPPEVIDLLKTFATQSALAIQNARLFREIEAKSRELEVAGRHKSEFLANMSHELRTPLNAIIGYSEMVQEEAEALGAEGLVPDLKKINSAGKHLLDLINSVLDLSKIEAGKMELYLETFSVPDMVRDIAGVVQPLAEKRSNRLDVRCDEGAGTMRADLTKVRQALFNLLSNACKFTERGTVSLTVGRDSTDAGERLTFEVKDTGIGITPEQMTRLFHEFSQADAEVTRRYGGTGLGLALSRRLCRMMGGDISAESEAGRGSTFTIRLPASVTEPSAEAAAVGGAARPANGTAGTVLVIDDDATVRDLMERFLDKEGFRVVTAAGGQEGLRLARELRPDAITLDVMMPAMDGWAVLSALKSDHELSDIPVIMLTILDARNMGYALGASDHLTKPIDRDRLAAVLKKYRRDLPVLVVDDDADLRRRLRRLLEQDGYSVAEAEHGRDALARLPEISPGLILLDLMMPEMDGFEFVVELRRHEAWRAIPVIVITARDLSAEDRRRLNGYVEKVLQKGAYSRDALLAEVRELVAASIARRRGGR